MEMQYLALLCAAMCLSFFGAFIVCGFVRSLELTRRSDDTKRFPRYGVRVKKDVIDKQNTFE